MGIDPTHGQHRPDPLGDRQDRRPTDTGQFRRFTGNDYTTDLTKGNVWVALAYSGDIVQLRADNPDLRFVYPDEGAMQFTDNMMIPRTPRIPTRPRR